MIKKEFNAFKKEKKIYLKILKKQIFDIEYARSHFKHMNAIPFQSATLNEMELLRTQHIFRKDKIWIMVTKDLKI